MTGTVFDRLKAAWIMLLVLSPPAAFGDEALPLPPAPAKPNAEAAPNDVAAPTADRAEPFTFGLARSGGATMEDAYRLFASMARDHGRLPADLPVETMSFCDLERRLVSLSVVSPRWRRGPADYIERDTLAYMSCGYLGLRPGLLTGCFGMTRRYAHREMQYRDLIAPGSPRTIVSGSELLSVTTRVAARASGRPEPTLTPDEFH